MPGGEKMRRATLATLAVALLLPVFIALLIADTSHPRPSAASTIADDGGAAGADVALADVTAPPGTALHSRWVSQSPLRVVALGENTTISISFRNVGSTAWIRGSAAEARLGVANDDRRFFDLGFAQNWLAPDRPAAQTEDVVPPGALANFSFHVRGTVTGVHRIPLRPLVEGVTWMEDEGAYVEFWVR
jgi:hypothetical protein